MNIDLSQFRKVMEKRSVDLPNAIKRILTRTGEAGTSIMMDEIEKFSSSGDMRRSVDYKYKRGKDRITIAPRLDSIYPLIVLKGHDGGVGEGLPWTPIARWARRHNLPPGNIYGWIKYYGMESHKKSAHRVNYPKNTKEKLERRAPKIAEDTISEWVHGGI